VRLALELSGGAGYLRTSPIERLYRDVHGALFHPLPRAKQLQFSGRLAAGLAPVG
jgi:acyl-CoA dehydrogenase